MYTLLSLLSLVVSRCLSLSLLSLSFFTPLPFPLLSCPRYDRVFPPAGSETPAVPSKNRAFLDMADVELDRLATLGVPYHIQRQQDETTRAIYMPDDMYV